MKFSHSQKRLNDIRPKLEQIRRIMEDLALFAEVMLRVDLWEKQQEILRSLAQNSRTAVKACHASGKTRTAAVAALWWIAHRPHGIVVTTAPTWHQVERVIWQEIHGLLAESRYAFPKSSATRLHLDSNRYAFGLSTNEGVRFQGLHGDVLVILDEAPGILPGIYEAIEGIRAGGDVRVLALGNPVISSGPFYDAFTSGRAGWNTHHHLGLRHA